MSVEDIIEEIKYQLQSIDQMMKDERDETLLNMMIGGKGYLEDLLRHITRRGQQTEKVSKS